MRWEDERYVRVYTRDTSDWLAMRWEARCCFALMLRKCDRAGILAVKSGPRRIPAVAGLLGVPLEVATAAIEDLLEDGCMVERECGYLFPRYIEAQEAPASDAKRAKEHRARSRDQALAASQIVTPPNQNVTPQHETPPPRDETVTPSRAVPSVPCRAVPKRGSAPFSPPGEFVDRIQAEFRKQRGADYDLTSADETAVGALLGKGPEEEIHRRWAIALRRTAYPRVNTLVELVKHWNACASEAGATTGPPKGAATAADKDWSNAPLPQTPGEDLFR